MYFVVMSSHIERLFMAIALAALVGGCGKKTAQATVDPKAFDAAAPEVKQVWDQATAAAAAKDFGAAIASIRLLSRQEITVEQREAAHAALVAYESQLKEIARQGDPLANKSIKELGISPEAPGR